MNKKFMSKSNFVLLEFIAEYVCMIDKSGKDKGRNENMDELKEPA